MSRAALLTCIVALASAIAPERVDAEESFRIAVEEQSLGSALQALAEQLDVQIVFFSGATRGLVAAPLSGTYTREQAFDAILAGTKLQYVFLNENSVAIQFGNEPLVSPVPPSPAERRHRSSDATGPRAVPDSAPSRGFGMEEIVVTGTASRGRTKIQSSIGISTFDRANITERAPSSTADLIAAVPGFWVESTAGTTQGNVFARGIVQDGGYRYVGLIEDGLPVYPVFELSFYNPDQFIRISESVARVEVVRGGTSPIFTAGAAGGTINFVNESPSATTRLRIKGAVSDFNAHSLDMYWSASMSDQWRMAVSGYVRRSDGIRDPGYAADDGGQVRIELRRLGSKSDLSVYAKYIDDRSLFGVPIPLRGAPSNPVAVDGSAAGQYSLHSADARAARLPASALEAGVSNDDLADGIRPRLVTAGFLYQHFWRSDLSLSAHSRLTDGDVTFNGLFTGDAPVTGVEFADVREVTPNFRYIDSGESFDPLFLVQNHGHWAVFKSYRALQNDTRLNFVISGHDMALGIYAADYSMADRWSLGNLLLLDVASQPRRLFLENATDSAGFSRYSFLNLRADYNASAIALYASDEWELGDRLRLDAALRYDHQSIDGFVSDGIPNIDLDGDPATPYDIASLAGESRTRVMAEFDNLTYSIGFNYDVAAQQAAFGHYTRSAKLPHFDDVRNDILRKDAVTNVEIGYKVSFDTLALFLTGFETKFDNVPFSDILVDGSIIVRQAETRTYGVELEGFYEPVDGVSVQLSLTLQDPEYRRFAGASVDNSGNRVRRIPTSMIRVVPSIDFAGGRGRAFVTVSHFGSRYANDENTIELPSYVKLDAGLRYSFSDSWSAQLNVDNLSNEVGLTEGNPRTDVGASGIGQLYNARTLFGRSFVFAVHYNFQSG